MTFFKKQQKPTENYLVTTTSAKQFKRYCLEITEIKTMTFVNRLTKWF